MLFRSEPETAEIVQKDLSAEIKFLKERLLKTDFSDKNNIEQEFRKAADDLKLKARDLVHPVRVALTGAKVGPGLFEAMEVLGREKVVQRLDRLLDFFKKGGGT